METKTCTTCKFEPEWYKPSYRNYSTGYCPKLPSFIQCVCFFLDNAGKTYCGYEDSGLDYDSVEEVHDCSLREAK